MSSSGELTTERIGKPLSLMSASDLALDHSDDDDDNDDDDDDDDDDNDVDDNDSGIYECEVGA